MQRRSFLALSAIALPQFTPPVYAPQEAPSGVKVYEYTFLQSLAPKPDAAIEYITKNWFVMDEIAVKQGLMLNYSLFEASAESENWNIVVAVGYPTEQGYEAIVKEFEAIRKQHTKVLVNGKDLSGLAKIVGSRKLIPRVQSKR